MTDNTSSEKVERSRFAKWKPDAITLILIAIIAYLWLRPGGEVSEVNQPVPQFTATALGGQHVDLEILEGKVVVLNFWATWCRFCKKEMPILESLQHDYGSKGLEVLTFNVDEDPAKVPEFVKRNGYSLPVVLADSSLRRKLGRVEKLPTSFVIDGKGTIRQRVEGSASYGQLEGLIKPLLPD